MIRRGIGTADYKCALDAYDMLQGITAPRSWYGCPGGTIWNEKRAGNSGAVANNPPYGVSGVRTRFFPTKEGMLFRRWQPGQGYQGRSGVTGLGYIDPETGEEAVFFDDTIVDYADGYIDPETGEQATFDSNPVSDEQIAADYAAVIASGKAHPGDIGTPTSILAKDLTKALTSGAVVLSKINPSTGKKACPSGYASPSGYCVSVTGGGVTTGQWVSFATNKQLITWGAVVIGALVFVKLASKR